MQRIPVVTGFDQNATAFFAVGTGQTQVQLAAHTAFFIKQRLARNAVVNYIHYAADSAAAVQQSARPAQHLDALYADRVGRHRVVIAQARRIHRCTAVSQNANSVAIQPANDRPADVGAKVGAADAWHPVERFAQGGFAAQQQLGAGIAGSWCD